MIFWLVLETLDVSAEPTTQCEFFAMRRMLDTQWASTLIQWFWKTVVGLWSTWTWHELILWLLSEFIVELEKRGSELKSFRK
jgi:hypothetical protein